MIGPVALIAGGSVVWTVTAIGLRKRLPAPVVTIVLALAGMVIAVGGLLLQVDRDTNADWAAALLFMAFAGPFQARIAFGPFGENRGLASGTVGRD